jgi:hypothetical protein
LSSYRRLAQELLEDLQKRAGKDASTQLRELGSLSVKLEAMIKGSQVDGHQGGRDTPALCPFAQAEGAAFNATPETYHHGRGLVRRRGSAPSVRTVVGWPAESFLEVAGGSFWSGKRT